MGRPASLASRHSSSAWRHSAAAIFPRAHRSRWVMVASCLACVSMPPLAMHGEVVGIDEVGNRPTFEVVLCHALLRESLETLGIAVRERAEQAVAADLLRA